MSQQLKYLLEEDRIPKSWYNIQSDLPRPLSPPLHPGKLAPDHAEEPPALGGKVQLSVSGEEARAGLGEGVEDRVIAESSAAEQAVEGGDDHRVGLGGLQALQQVSKPGVA